MPNLRCAARALCAAGACLAALLSAQACSPREGRTERASIFESTVVLTLRDHASDAAFEACFARLREIDAELNMWSPDSELSRFNARAGMGPVPVSADLAATLERGLELARLSGGIFDPSVAPLVRLWGIGTKAARVPAEAEIRSALALVDWRRVALDRPGGKAALGAGQSLDFGALAKGFAAEEGSRLLAGLGVRSAILDVGGCVAVIGSGVGLSPWKIGVQDPRSPRGTPLGYFSLRDSAVDTSGIYERYFEIGGRRYAHIMDTRTGRPLSGEAISASVALPRSENSDGPALVLLVLGPEEGIAFADKLGLDAVILDGSKGLHLSIAARKSFTLIDKAYKILP
jgi:FAD:protein FMN transferase